MDIGIDFRMNSDVYLKHENDVKFGNHVAIDKEVLYHKT